MELQSATTWCDHKHNTFEFLVFSPIQQLPWRSNIMADKGLNVFCSAKCVYLSPRKKSAPPLPDGTVKWTHLAPKQVHRGRQLK